jgi:hypothetical protein
MTKALLSHRAGTPSNTHLRKGNTALNVLIWSPKGWSLLTDDKKHKALVWFTRGRSAIANSFHSPQRLLQQPLWQLLEPLAQEGAEYAHESLPQAMLSTRHSPEVKWVPWSLETWVQMPALQSRVLWQTNSFPEPCFLMWTVRGGHATCYHNAQKLKQMFIMNTFGYHKSGKYSAPIHQIY